MTTGQTFALQIGAFCDKAGARADAFVREFIQDFYGALVEASPVKTGFFKKNWQGSLGPPPGGLVPNNGFAAGGGAVSIAALLEGVHAGGQPFYIYNNANYGVYIEFGTHNMAARAPVRNTLARAPEIALAALTRVTGGA